VIDQGSPASAAQVPASALDSTPMAKAQDASHATRALLQCNKLS
jgi:hypothetical protein